MTIGIRRENKGKWEQRAPFAPHHVQKLIEAGFRVHIEESTTRAYPASEYENCGAQIVQNLEQADYIFGVKEVPLDKFIPGKTYFFFSHTIKGQAHNMPSLKEMMKQKITLVDYERITNSDGRRLVFFGPFAGNAGMIDALWGLGLKWKMRGYENPFEGLKQATHYYDLKDAKRALRMIGEKITSTGFHKEIGPVIIGFSGYGNVSLGAQEMLNQLPVTEIGPQDLLNHLPERENNLNTVYKVVLTLSDLYEFKSGDAFDKFVFFKSPELFQSKSSRYWSKLTMLVNAIYWSEKADRIVSKNAINEGRGKLEFISDISCDIEGGIEITSEATNQESPFLTYDAVHDKSVNKLKGDGISLLAVDNLPCELSIDATRFFGDALTPFLLRAGSDLAVIDRWPRELQNALILNRGKLTENYTYLTKYLYGG